MLRPFNLRDMRSDANEVVFLSPDFVNDIELKLFYRNDLAFARVGNVGCSIITQEKVTISPNIIACSLKPKALNPAYAALFFNTKYGRLQMEGAIKAVAQPTISTSLIRELRLPVISERIQTLLQEMLETADKLALESCSLLMRAEQTLLAVLGLNDWQPPEPLTYTCGSRDVLSTQRLDAEYFLPKYGALYVEMKSRLDLKALAVAGQVTKGVTVAYADEGLIPIIRSGDLVDISDDERFLRSNKTADIFYLERGDVLISSIGFGSIGKVQVFDREGKYGTVSEVTVVRQKSFNPYYLAAYLRSMAGQMQIERYITGATGQLHLYPKDVAKILVPVIPEKEQNAFETIALRAAAFKQEARDLLARAQRTVEIAIEEGEAAGMAVLAGGAHG